jgi:hypothetical protein
VVTVKLVENVEHDVGTIIFDTTRQMGSTRTNESLRLGGKVYRDLESPISIGLTR